MDLAHLNDRGLLLVGCGKMGQALLDGWLARGVRPSAVHVTDPSGKVGELVRARVTDAKSNSLAAERLI